MENYIPNYQNETNKFKGDWNKVLDVLRRNQPQSSTDIYVNQTTHGTFFTVSDRIKYKPNEGLNWAGVYNMTGSYGVNDLVLVDPNISYSVPFEFSGSSTVPPLSPGLFLCINPVPASSSWNTSYNCYYPIYPTIPSSSQVTVSGSLANQTFWQPISPMSKITLCVNGSNVPAFVNLMVSGSTFNMAWLPYSA